MGATNGGGASGLDPRDWDAYRREAHRLLDALIAHQQGLRERPAWQPIPPEVDAKLRAPLPREGAPLEDVLADLERLILPYPLGNGHPRFWGWVTGNGTPDAVLAEAAAAALAPNVGGADHAAVRVEAVVLDWLKQMLGWPADASGIFVSGGSHANLTALAVARHVHAGHDVREDGLAGHAPLVAYGSEEMHSSSERAFEILGIGRRNVRKIPVDDAFAMRPELLQARMRDDRARGLRPFAIVATVGTTNTAAIDPLDEIVRIAREERVWLHVDGAFGALACLAPQERRRLEGIARADSLAFDLHKWGWLPIACGVALVRRRDEHLAAFTMHPPYLATSARGPGGTHDGKPWFTDLGIESSRPFRGLKAYVALRHHGVAAWQRVIEQNLALARRLSALVESTEPLELLAPTTLNVVCFRVRAPGADEAALDALNEEVVLRLQESGFAVPSGTRLRGRYAIRCCFVNHRTTSEDVDAFLARVLATAEDVRQGA